LVTASLAYTLLVGLMGLADSSMNTALPLVDQGFGE
jgi:hypothetical protein